MDGMIIWVCGYKPNRVSFCSIESSKSWYKYLDEDTVFFVKSSKTAFVEMIQSKWTPIATKELGEWLD